MISLSGRSILPENDNFPSLSDVATALSREARFSGQLRVWPWTVAHHSLLVHGMAGYYSERQRLAVVVHDFHEAVTRDISTPWKTGAVREMQTDLDRRLWRHMELPFPTERTKEIVRFLDRRALVAEGALVAPEGWLARAGLAYETDHVAEEIVRELIEWKDPVAVASRLKDIVRSYVPITPWSTT